MIEQETVPCEPCGTPTPMTGTKRCNGCWELERRICMDPELARKILQDYDKDTEENSDEN